MEYKIIDVAMSTEIRAINQLGTEVNKAMSDGWECTGGIGCKPDEYLTFLFQAMVKK